MKRVMKVLALLAVVPALMIGCSDSGSRDRSTTNPAPNEFQPKGTIQGYLVDAVTNDPIVGAVVDIGVGTGKTNERGQFTIKDVPATSDALNETVSGSYNVVIDLRGVSSPVNMGNASASPRYPNFSFPGSVEVSFTSLNDTEGDNAGGGSGSNHDTPVVGLVADFGHRHIGKLAATIKGCVVDSETRASVGEGYDVKLVSNGSSNNASGASGRVVAQTVTDENGEFTFANVESFGSFEVVATNSSNLGSRSVSAPADGETLDLTCSTGGCEAVAVSSVDDCDPIIISCTPEALSDLAPQAGQAVTFTFSEPIKANAYALALTEDKAAIAGLWNDVVVERSSKAGNVAHTLAWSEDRTALTVTFDTIGQSRYDVGFDDYDSDPELLTDDAGNSVNFSGSVCTDTVFTTDSNVAGGAAAPVIALANGPLDYDDTPVLDWDPAAGAKSYNVYCGVSQVWGETVNEHELDFRGNTSSSAFTDSSRCGEGSFVENNSIKLTFTYVVKSVDVNGLESGASNELTVSDTVAPQLVDGSAPGLFLPSDGESQTFTYTFFFSEPMAEASVEDATLAITGTPAAGAVTPTLTSVVQTGPSTVQVTLTVTNPSNAPDPDAETSVHSDIVISFATATDVAANAINATRDQAVFGALPDGVTTNPF